MARTLSHRDRCATIKLGSTPRAPLALPEARERRKGREERCCLCPRPEPPSLLLPPVAAASRSRWAKP
jgi:hypothetical protein